VPTLSFRQNPCAEHASPITE